MSKFKTGQTIPAKFDLKDVNGIIVQQTVSPTFNYAPIGASCGPAAPDTIDLVYPASTLPIYMLNGGHYQYNWSTKGVASGLYRIFAKLNDGTTSPSTSASRSRLEKSFGTKEGSAQALPLSHVPRSCRFDSDA